MTDLRPILQADPEDVALPDLQPVWQRGRRRRLRRRAGGIGAVAAVLILAGVAWSVVGDGDTEQTLAHGTGTPRDSAEPLDPADSTRLLLMQGSWILAAAEIDGDVVASGLSLEIKGSFIVAETICGQTVGGQLDGQFEVTGEGCDADGPAGLDDLEERFISTLAGTDDGSSGSGIPDSLIFGADGVTLTYERATEVTAEELFSALDDPSLAVEPSENTQDPQPGDGLELEKLARLEHPSTEGSFFVGTDGEKVCLIVSSDIARAATCHSGRTLELRAAVVTLSIAGSPNLSVAFIPDAFVQAAAELSEIGVAAGNVLVLNTDAGPGAYLLTNGDGQQLGLLIDP